MGVKVVSKIKPGDLIQPPPKRVVQITESLTSVTIEYEDGSSEVYGVTDAIEVTQ